MIQAFKSSNRLLFDKGKEFVMSCIVMCIGLTNIWRFPYVAYENGGGSFLIAYLITLLLMCRPVLYMEMIIGQLTGRGNVKALTSLAPALRGLGYVHVATSLLLITYCCPILTIMLIYLINSFKSPLPWSVCNTQWTGVECIPSKHDKPTSDNTSYTSAELWSLKEVFKEYVTIEHGIGYPDAERMLYLTICWVTVFVIASKGTKFVGMATYFLAVLPYTILLPLLIKSMGMPGSFKGIMYLLTPQWSKLLDAKVWFEAVAQCLVSLNIGLGTVILYASFNRKDHNIEEDCAVISVLDSITAMIAAFIVFAGLGNVAFELNIPVNKVIKRGGPSLAFFVYSLIISKFEHAPYLFSIYFFLIAFVLGVANVVALESVILNAILDLSDRLKPWHASALTAGLGIFFGIAYMTPGGEFILLLMDQFVVPIMIYFSASSEILCISWWYGVRNFCIDLKYMTNEPIKMYWKICWALISPIGFLTVFCFYLSAIKTQNYDVYSLPTREKMYGLIIIGLGISQPLYWWLLFLHHNRESGLKSGIMKSFETANWGPKYPNANKEWRHFRYHEEQKLKARASNWIRSKLDIMTY